MSPLGATPVARAAHVAVCVDAQSFFAIICLVAQNRKACKCPADRNGTTALTLRRWEACLRRMAPQT